MDLLLIRHAEPVRVGPGERGDGPADPELTATGHEQAARLAGWLAHERVDAIRSSPLRRATETAAPLALATGLAVEIDERLREWDAEANHYIPMEELRALKDERWHAMVAGRWEDYGGEDPGRFRARIVATIDEIAATHPGGTVALVCHGGVINVYVGAVLGIDRHLWFEPAYTSITRVKVSRTGVRSLATLNESAHLVAERGSDHRG